MISFIENIDQTVLFFIQSLHCQFLDSIMILFSTLGNKGTIWLIIASILFLSKKTRIIGILTIVSLVLADLLGEEILKNIFCRPRPYTVFPWVNLLIDQMTFFCFSFRTCYFLICCSIYIKQIFEEICPCLLGFGISYCLFKIIFIYALPNRYFSRYYIGHYLW